MDYITTLQFSVAVNHGKLTHSMVCGVVSVSPDGQKMVSVGDSNQVHLFEVTTGGAYQPVEKLTTVNDAGFSCAWDRSSERFAVATQDGFVCVWDVRKLSAKLAQLPAAQKGQKGACRSVKFSQGGSIDLLAFSEVRPLAHESSMYPM